MQAGAEGLTGKLRAFVNNEGQYKAMWLACSPLDPRFAGSIPAEVDGFLRVIKIRSTTSFGGEVKPPVPCRRFTACKRTVRA